MTTGPTILFALALGGAPDADAAPADDMASSDPTPDPASLVDRGDAYYAVGQFAEAAAAFAEAHAADPDPATLYRWAQAERRAGNCAVALQLYRRYLDAPDLDPANAEAARKNAARCGHVGESTRTETTDPGPPQLAPERDDGPPPTAWQRDPLAVTLLATGGAGIVASLVLGVQSESQRRRAKEAAVEDDYVEHAARGRSLGIAAGVVGGISAALVVGGVVRYLVVRKRHRDRVAFGPGTVAFRF